MLAASLRSAWLNAAKLRYFSNRASPSDLLPPLKFPHRAPRKICNYADGPTQKNMAAWQELILLEWLQDIIALQCSIMRHLSINQKVRSATSSEFPAEFETKKTCVTSEEMKTQAAEERTSPAPSSKPCGIPEHTQAAHISRDTSGELGVCKCSMAPCPKCRKPNGPLAELQPPKSNGPLDCKSASDPCRQPDLQHRLKTNTSSDSPLPSGLMNHIGIETVKKDPESTPEACTQKNCPTGSTICPLNSQQNHRSQTELQEFCLSSDEKPPPSITSSSLSDGAKGSYKQNSTKQGPLSPPPDVKAGPALMDSLVPSTLSSITNLSTCINSARDIGGIELDKLDEEMIKLLAYQRIQQLFPPKALSSPPLLATSPFTKLPPQHHDSQKKVQARAVFYPLAGRGETVSMCYRTLYIGSGADMDVCLTNYGHCNYISGKHACIFYDENTKHYELLNYSEHGTTVDNVLYSCDFSEKASPSPPSSLVAKVQGIIRRSKKREEDRVVSFTPAAGVMSSQPYGSIESSCSCKVSSSSLIGGSGAGWEGTALLHHGSYIKLGCLQFVFSITEFADQLPKAEHTVLPPAGCTSTTQSSCNMASSAPASTSTPAAASAAMASSPSSQDEADAETAPPHQVPVLRYNFVP